jgi:hypothetical protein
VTIVAGFRSYEGIVVCADTQETVNNLSKRNVPKLIFQPVEEYGETQALSANDLAVAFCGAADNGPFVDKLVENAWEDMQVGTSLDEACTLIETSIKRTYKEYGQIFQTGYCPSADLIYGVKMSGASKLFSANGPIVIERTMHYSGGAGYYMADFLASRMYHDGMNLRQCVILAAYILFQAREHVDGCGGDSQIAILRNDGVSGKVDYLSIDTINKMFRCEDAGLGRLILHAADLEIDNKEFQEHARQIAEIAASTRQIEAWQYKATRANAMSGLYGTGPSPEVDEYGLPMPSDSQT